jgi:hypothetical protein
MEDKDRAEKEAEKGRVKMLKNYGDVLRNTVVKLGNDVIDFIPFCDNIEKQFKELKVPSELRVSLLKPFLNERARLLVSRLDAERQDDYDYVKQYLLDQFRLVPQYFLEMFNSVCRQSNDTYKSFISRLSLLLDYYLSSRKVKTFDELKQLLISDRVKATLPEGPLNHLLKVEASLPRKYALPDEAAEALDTYYANYDSRDRPRVSAIGMMAGRATVKPGNKPVFPSASKTTMSPAREAATGSQLKQPGLGAKRTVCLLRVRLASSVILRSTYLRIVRCGALLVNPRYVSSVALRVLYTSQRGSARVTLTRSGKTGVSVEG